MCRAMRNRAGGASPDAVDSDDREFVLSTLRQMHRSQEQNT